MIEEGIWTLQIITLYNMPLKLLNQKTHLYGLNLKPRAELKVTVTTSEEDTPKNLV